MDDHAYSKSPMSPQRVVLLFSVVIASVIFAVIAYLFSGGRTYMYVLDTRQIVSVGAAVRVDAVFATVASPSAPPGLTRKSEDVLRHGERRISPETLSSSIDTPASLAARSQEHSEPGVLNATEESLHIQNVNAVLVATFSSPDSLDAKYLQQDSESLDASNHPEEVKYPSVDMRNTQYHSHSHSETDTSHHPVALHQHSSPNDVGMGVSHSASAPTFTVQNNFNFPHPRNYLPAQEILEADWVKQLKRYLLNIHPAHSLTLTVATKSFIPNLLNWLIAAHLLVDPPLQHILVVAFDKEVHTLMAGRKLASIHVPVSSVTKGIRREILRLWMTRLAVIRLLNHWGYDVQQFDNDAVLLRNPQPLFDAYSDYDLFGARGSLPFHLGKGPWEFALCMGAAWLRGTEKMGEAIVKCRTHASLLHVLCCFCHLQKVCGMLCIVIWWKRQPTIRRELTLPW